MLDRNFDGSDNFSIEKIHKEIEIKYRSSSNYGLRSRIKRFRGDKGKNLLLVDRKKGRISIGKSREDRDFDMIGLTEYTDGGIIYEEDISYTEEACKKGVALKFFDQALFSGNGDQRSERKRMIRFALENDCAAVVYEIRDSTGFEEIADRRLRETVKLHKECQMPLMLTITHLSLLKQLFLIKILNRESGGPEGVFINCSLAVLSRIPKIYKKNIIISIRYTDSPMELFYLCKEAMNNGVLGITIDMSIIKGENPRAMIQVLRLILDKNISTSKAQKFYEILKEDYK